MKLFSWLPVAAECFNNIPLRDWWHVACGDKQESVQTSNNYRHHVNERARTRAITMVPSLPPSARPTRAAAASARDCIKTSVRVQRTGEGSTSQVSERTSLRADDFTLDTSLHKRLFIFYRNCVLISHLCPLFSGVSVHLITMQAVALVLALAVLTGKYMYNLGSNWMASVWSDFVKLILSLLVVFISLFVY